MSKVFSHLSLLAVLVLAACSSNSSSGSTSPGSSQTSGTHQSSSASSSISPTPTAFTSQAYGYSLTVPARWSTRQAYVKWDGKSELDGTATEADIIGQPGETRGVWAAAAPTKLNLAAETAFAIKWNTDLHGDYCPRRPTMRTRVLVGHQPGVLLAYNCGILVNTAVTVHRGVEYWFSFVDHGVAAASDPADHAMFMRILSSIQLPN